MRMAPDLSQTAVHSGGWTWTIGEHIFALVYIAVLVWWIARYLKFKKTGWQVPMTIAVLTTVLSFITELTFPIYLALLAVILFFAVSLLLLKYLYRISWRDAAKA